MRRLRLDGVNHRGWPATAPVHLRHRLRLRQTGDERVRGKMADQSVCMHISITFIAHFTWLIWRLLCATFFLLSVTTNWEICVSVTVRGSSFIVPSGEKTRTSREVQSFFLLLLLLFVPICIGFSPIDCASPRRSASLIPLYAYYIHARLSGQVVRKRA